MQDELILFRKMQEGDSGGGGRHRAGHVHLFVGESGEDYPFRFSLRLSESFCQEFLY